MFAMPWSVANLAASLGHKIRCDNALSCGEVDDGERCGIFDCIVKRPPALIEWCPVFRKTLPETNEIRDAFRDWDDQNRKETRTKGTNLINVGKTQRDQPSWGGNMSRLPLGSSIHKESQISPKTLA